jgi:parallel beta-helix repeat protein
MSITKVRASTLDFTPLTGGKGVNVLSITGVDKTGVASSQTALQNYIDNFVGTNLTLYFPAGLYKFNQLKLAGTVGTKNTSLIGEERSTVTIQKFNPNNSLSLIVGAAAGQISDITFDWDASSTFFKQTIPTVDYNCLYLAAANSLCIQNCAFTNAPYAGILVGADQTSPTAFINLLIEDCLFSGNQTSVHGKNVNQGSKICRNLFKDLAAAPAGGQVKLEGSSYTLVGENTFVISNAGYNCCVLSTCLQCHVSDNNITLFTGCNAIVIDTTSVQCSVEGNLITGASSTSGARILNSTGCKVTDNLIQNCTQGVYIFTATNTIVDSNVIKGGDNGVLGISCVRTNVNGNSIMNMQNAGIYLSSEAFPIVSSNQITDPNLVAATSGSTNSGISLDVVTSGGSIVGNAIFTVTGNPVYGIYANNASGVNGVALGNVCSSSRTADFSLTGYATTGNL